MSLDIWLEDKDENQVFDINITHNLTLMARECDLYIPMWRPEEIGAEKAKDLIPALKAGAKKLLSSEVELSKLNPSNGWGSYEILKTVAVSYLGACIRNPDAKVRVWR